MADYKSRVVSVRLDAELVEAVRERAESEGRSLSGQIVYFVREQVAVRGRSDRKPRPITGWLEKQPNLDTLAQFRSAREEASAQLKRSVTEKARRR